LRKRSVGQRFFPKIAAAVVESLVVKRIVRLKQRLKTENENRENDSERCRENRREALQLTPSGAGVGKCYS